MRLDATYCSEKCNSQAHQITRKMYRRKGPEKIKGTPLISRVHVAAKTNFKCGICLGPVDMQLKHPNPKFASIDHIVPLAKGGTNEISNLQIAHLHCNLSKGADASKNAVTAQK